MSDRGRRVLIGLVVTGLAIRLLVVFGTSGFAFDVDSYRSTGDDLVGARWRVYEVIVDRTAERGEVPQWPYPPGLFPWLLFVELLGRIVRFRYAAIVKLPMILADAGLAVAVGRYAGGFIESERRRLQAAALIALGPSFFLISAYLGQIDGLAILPALIGFLLWRVMPDRWKAVAAGVLIGIGTAIKTVPIILAAALVPESRSVRERARLVASAVIVPAFALAPFFIVTPNAVLSDLRYAGGPGVGGISLVLQPSLSRFWIARESDVGLSTITRALSDNASLVVVLTLGAAAVFSLVCRARAEHAAVLLLLGMYSFSPHFFLQYFVWGIPFFLLAGHFRGVLALQAVLAAPTLILLLGPWPQVWIRVLYVVLMIVAWVGVTGGFFLQARTIWTHRRLNAALVRA